MQGRRAIFAWRCCGYTALKQISIRSAPRRKIQFIRPYRADAPLQNRQQEAPPFRQLPRRGRRESFNGHWTSHRAKSAPRLGDAFTERLEGTCCRGFNTRNKLPWVWRQQIRLQWLKRYRRRDEILMELQPRRLQNLYPTDSRATPASTRMGSPWEQISKPHQARPALS